MAGLTVAFPDDVLHVLGVSFEEAPARIRLLLAAKLYELKRASVGNAAAIAGLDMAAFLEEYQRLQAPPAP